MTMTTTTTTTTTILLMLVLAMLVLSLSSTIEIRFVHGQAVGSIVATEDEAASDGSSATATSTASETESATTTTESAVIEEETDTATSTDGTTAAQEAEESSGSTNEAAVVKDDEPVQSGPLVDLLGPKLYSLQKVNEEQVQIQELYTTDALRKKDVIGLYFSADWCGPCRQFTPELVNFYEKMNKKTRGSFEIVWISRCRDINSYVNYFAHMPWIALPPEEASGERGEYLGRKYGVKGIPSLVLLDDLGNTITTDARNKVPQDRNGIGFPWRNPVSQIYSMVVPRSLRMLIKLQMDSIQKKLFRLVGQK